MTDRKHATDLPERIGKYRILGLLGRGAMGHVFDAEQTEPERRVALKVIREPFASERLRRRFRNEAQALGCLNHPGIATVYEAGTAQIQGETCPYIAMERIDGRTLDEFLADPAPSLRARVELLARICDAVQHAHQKGVVHRDLKPANVLVGADGRPKVLDFGIARFLDAAGREATLTGTGQLPGTLPYMSPEHFSGEPSRIDPRSDVYSLGVLLFEALSGARPFDLEGLPLAEAARVVSQGNAPLLGSRDPRFRGDLETIVAKALETEPDRRYGSAAELAADLRRFLDHEPVLARPMTTLYRLRKFARRNRWLVAGAASTVGALALGLLGTALFAVRASARAADAEAARLEASRFESEMLAAETRARDAATTASAAERDARNQARTAGAVRDLLVRVLERARPVRTQGRPVTVLEALSAASDELASEGFPDPEVERAIHATLARVFGTLGSFDAAVEHGRAAIRIADAVHGSASPQARAERVWLGVLLLAVDRSAPAEALFREVVAASDLTEPARESELQGYVALGHLGAIERGRGHVARAVELSERALRGLRPFAAEHPGELLWELHHMSEHCTLSGDRGRELACAREAYDLAVEYGFERLTTPLDILTQLGNALDDNGLHEEALERYEEALAKSREWYGDNVDTLMVRFNMALAQQALGRFEEARDNLELAFEGLSAETPRPAHAIALVIKGMLDTYGNNGRAEQGLVWMDAHAPDVPAGLDGALIRIARSQLLLSVGALEEAFDTAREGFRGAAAVLSPGHPHLLDALEVLVQSAAGLDREAERARWAAERDRQRQAAAR